MAEVKCASGKETAGAEFILARSRGRLQQYPPSYLSLPDVEGRAQKIVPWLLRALVLGRRLKTRSRGSICIRLAVIDLLDGSLYFVVRTRAIVCFAAMTDDQ